MATKIDVNELWEQVEAGGDAPRAVELPQKMSRADRETWAKIVRTLADRRDNEQKAA